MMSYMISKTTFCMSHLQPCVFHSCPFVSQLLHVLLVLFWHHELNWNEPKTSNAHMNRFKPQRSQWTGNGSLSATQITSDETAGFGHTHSHTHTHTRTHTHTHIQLAFHVLWGLSLDRMIFTLYKLHILSPTPKLTHHRNLSAFYN